MVELSSSATRALDVHNFYMMFMPTTAEFDFRGIAGREQCQISCTNPAHELKGRIKISRDILFSFRVSRGTWEFAVLMFFQCGDDAVNKISTYGVAVIANPRCAMFVVR